MSSNSLELLEATGEGVTSYPLFSRLRAYSDTKFAEYMCLRRLDVGRDIELFQKLHRFTARVVGKPYGFTFSKLISARSLRSSATTNLSDAPSASFPRTHSESDLGAVIQARSPSYLPASNGNLIDRSKSTQKRLTQDMSAACGEPSSDIRASTATNRSSYSDLPSSGKGRRQSIPPKQGISTTDKVMKFFQEHRICKGESKRGSDDVTSELTGTAEEESVPPKLPDEDLSSFFCSELVAACLQIMDLLPKNINVSAIWPGSYTFDGDVDKMMLSGAAYGKNSTSCMAVNDSDMLFVL